MQELRKVFVTDGKPYKEGTVSVFEQRIEAENIKKAVLTITALGMYEAELGGRKVGDELFSLVTLIIRKNCSIRYMM